MLKKGAGLFLLICSIFFLALSGYTEKNVSSSLSFKLVTHNIVDTIATSSNLPNTHGESEENEKLEKELKDFFCSHKKVAGSLSFSYHSRIIFDYVLNITNSFPRKLIKPPQIS